MALAVAACGWDPGKPFDREAPAVKDAIRSIDAGDATAATTSLADYLSTGACAEGSIGTPDMLRRRPNGAFDLGLSLFGVGEAFGRRFGEEEEKTGASSDDAAQTSRMQQIDCALRIVRAFADDTATLPGASSEKTEVPIELMARARYLEGNLLFLGGKYEEAVKAYDRALTLSPGRVDAGDPIGRDAAWNRAIALRRIEDKKDAGQDAAPDAAQDASSDAKNEAGGGDGGGDGGGEGGHGDSGKQDPDSGEKPDARPDASPPPPRDTPDAAPPPPSQSSQDERMLDQLENAPTVQQEIAKKAAQRRKVRGMADK